MSAHFAARDIQLQLLLWSLPGAHPAELTPEAVGCLQASLGGTPDPDCAGAVRGHALTAASAFGGAAAWDTLDGSPMHLSTYLFFTTQCEAALTFYEACGLGRIVDITRFGDAGRAVANPAMRGRVLHARFEGPGVLFYASDNDDAEPMRGSAQFLRMTDRASTAALFARMSEGGRVTTPLDVKPWGDFYGKLTDRFGVQWMLNCPAEALARSEPPNS